VESEIVTLARATLGAALRNEPLPSPTLADPTYPSHAGAFVSLHRDGHLRGCIGTISPTKPTLGEEVAHNVLEAAFEDPRFEPLTAEEFGDLEMSVDVLRPAEPATIEELDPKRFGVIVTAGYRRGLLLPDLDGVDDAATQIDIALQKAGIRTDEDFTIQRFRVDRFH
jgi:AmmeMemoRadiSam system protein A